MHVIETSALTYTYAGGGAPAVKDLGFRVARGEIFGFLGPSGAGKSTTQKILIGLLRGYEGRVSLLGKELTAWGPEIYEHIGVSFEMPNHYLKLTARENLDYFRALYSGETEDPAALLALVGLTDDAHIRVGSFSKGMRMRLNFARALLNKPEILFLDEPTSGLDPVNARKIKDTILGLKTEGRTVFLTTHNMTDASELCDRVGFIVDGEIRLLEAPKALMKSHGERKVRVEYHVDGRVEAADFPLDGIGENQAFHALLREKDLETIHTLETTLEHVFIEVTGRALK
jgi:fluoroquinolone transport system ATP-binding protein